MNRFARMTYAALALVVLASPASAAPSTDAQVTGVSLLPSPGRAELVIGLNGAVTVKDFALANPSRIVLDLTGATLATPAEPVYDGVARAGVTNVRVRQNSPGVVRIVLDLDRDRTYTVHREDGQMRVTFGADESFLAWSSGVPAAARSLPETAPADAAVVPAPRVERPPSGRARPRSSGRSRASPSPGTRPRSPTWCRASPRSPAGPSCSARVSAGR